MENNEATPSTQCTSSENIDLTDRLRKAHGESDQVDIELPLSNISSWNFFVQKIRNKDNVTYLLLFFFLGALYESICFTNIFDAYLSLIAKSRGDKNYNFWVGTAESTAGVANVLFALPCAFLTDSYDRVFLSKLTGMIGIILSFLQTYVFTTGNVYLIYINLFLWGIYEALCTTAVYACFADSVPDKERLKCMTLASVLGTFARIVGPLINILMFATLSNQWTLEDVRIPLLGGTVLGPVAAFMLFCLRKDAHTNSRDLDSFSVHDEKTDPLLSHSNDPLQLSVAVGANTISTAAVTNNSDLSESFDTDNGGIIEQPLKYVPYIVSACELIAAIGAGMTVRFFSLFFINDYNIKPMQLCGINVVLYIVLALSFSVSEKLCDIIGRTRAALLCQSSGVVLLYLLANVYSPSLVILIYILRATFANAPGPINRSLMLDYSHMKDRGKWALVSCFSSGLWSMSAVVGSILADSHDYRYTFTLTAILYSFNTLLYSPLIFIVPKSGNIR